MRFEKIKEYDVDGNYEYAYLDNVTGKTYSFADELGDEKFLGDLNKLFEKFENKKYFEYVNDDGNVCDYIVDYVNGCDYTGNDLEHICGLLNSQQCEIQRLNYKFRIKFLKSLNDLNHD